MTQEANPARPTHELPDAAELEVVVTEPAEAAGGISAVRVALTLSIEQMGLARTASTLLDANQKDGFDCPGCAWPEPAARSVVEFCENGAKAIAEEATRRRLDREFFAQHSIAELAGKGDYWLSQQGRLTEPMFRAKGASHYTPIAWEEAFALVASHLKRLSTPDEAVFYTSGRTSNEAAFLYQLFVRMFGTNNLPDCSNLCHESSGFAMKRTIGSGKGTVLLRDFDYADTIIVIGQNPGTNHPRMLATLQAAARRGCRIISVNPLAEAGLKRFKHPQEVSGLVGSGTAIASRHVRVRVNGDVALLRGIQKAMFETHRAALDWGFIAAHTEGLTALEASLASESWEVIEESSGIAQKEIREVAAELAAAKRLIACWAMGLTQHRNAVDNIEEIINLLLLGGHIGRIGAGACPVRGHSNVQGDRTMGIWERPSAQFLDALAREFNFAPPREPGLSTVEAIEAMHEGRARVLFALGGNFLSATPDTAYTAHAIAQCALSAHVSTKLNRSHLVTGEEALILPCLGRTERDEQGGRNQVVTVENSMGVVHASRGRLDPAAQQLRSEVAIVAGLAGATLGVDWSSYTADYDTIRDRIERIVEGFAPFNERIHRDGEFTLPHAVRDRREFATPTGRARFTVHQIPSSIAREGELLLTTIRSHDQFNTTVYGLNDRYRGIRNGRRVLFMNPDDMRERSLAARDLVHLESGGRRARNFRVVPYDIPRGCVAAYFPETNALVPIDARAAGSMTPASKSVAITVARA